jgi:hypothetical protein
MKPFLYDSNAFVKSPEVKSYGKTIDYRCEDGRFPVSTTCVTISNTDMLFSSETEVNPGMRS